ncbi:MAG: ribonuclease Y [Oscillospiraceae bacterium]|nr:ribonuclease Y [Oscillospiraceae bacterium]
MNFDLTGIFKFAFNFFGDVMCKKHHFFIVNNFGFDNDSNFASCLDCEAVVNAFEGICDFFEFFKAFDIVFKIFASCSGSCCRNCVRCLNKPCDGGSGLNVAVMSFDCVDNSFGLFIFLRNVNTDGNVASFDPVRREIARLSLEKLIQDGRIHPARIEETVEKARKEVDAKIKQDGEHAVLECGVRGVAPELVRLLGRMRYRTSYGQNVLMHSIEVSQIAGLLANEMGGVDPNMARRAGLLHDIGKALTHEIEGSHVTIGVDVAKKYKEPEAVIHAIEAHHGDVEPRTTIAWLVQAADAISAARPGARRENLENYIKRLEKLEEIANSFEGVDNCFAIQAGREVRIVVKPEVVDDEKMVLLAHDIAEKIEGELEYPGQIKVHLVRESRAVDYAK